MIGWLQDELRAKHNNTQRNDETNISGISFINNTGIVFLWLILFLCTVDVGHYCWLKCININNVLIRYAKRKVFFGIVSRWNKVLNSKVTGNSTLNHIVAKEIICQTLFNGFRVKVLIFSTRKLKRELEIFPFIRYVAYFYDSICNMLHLISEYLDKIQFL